MCTTCIMRRRTERGGGRKERRKRGERRERERERKTERQREAKRRERKQKDVGREEQEFELLSSPLLGLTPCYYYYYYYYSEGHSLLGYVCVNNDIVFGYIVHGRLMLPQFRTYQ